MSEGAGFWLEGQHAWDRLARWCQYLPAADVRHQGDGALQALSDIVALRQLLDRVEFEAIRAGRQQGCSWAEIASRLGITRQSAWERWQDVDTEPPQFSRADALRDIVPELVQTRFQASPPEPPEFRTPRERRRRSTVVVPSVIGMVWDTALEQLRVSGLVGVSPDPDGPPMGALPWAGSVVTDQTPEAGAMVPPGSAVTLWVDRGEGGAGVREPRRPKPDSKTGRKMLDEQTKVARELKYRPPYTDVDALQRELSGDEPV